METRTQFTFYESFFKAVSRIRKAADRAAAYDAICAYALYGTEPNMEQMPDTAAVAFEVAKPNLDVSRRKAKNGRLGGAAKQSEASAKQTQANDKQNGSKTEANRKQEETAREKEIEYEVEYEIEAEAEAESEEHAYAHDHGGADYHEVKIMGGTLGKNVIRLSQAQSDALLDTIGFDMYNYYIERLADFIINTGAAPVNHYETILKWWKEDRKV